jgi:hypothetical protein
MKTQKTNNLVKDIFLGIFAIMMIFPSAACAKRIPFLNSSVVPAANGFAVVKKDNNKNYTIKIQVSDLAEVERLQSSKLTYVVWMQTDHGNMENLGQLKSSTSLFSKQHKASLKTVSSFKPSKIFITSEFEKNVRYPGMEVALTTDPF